MFDSLQPHGLQPSRLLCPQGFSRQEDWSGMPCPPPGDLPNTDTEPRSPAWQVDSLPCEPPGKPRLQAGCLQPAHAPELLQTHPTPSHPPALLITHCRCRTLAFVALLKLLLKRLSLTHHELGVSQPQSSYLDNAFFVRLASFSRAE